MRFGSQMARRAVPVLLALALLAAGCGGDDDDGGSGAARSDALAELEAATEASLVERELTELVEALGEAPDKGERRRITRRLDRLEGRAAALERTAPETIAVATRDCREVLRQLVVVADDPASARAARASARADRQLARAHERLTRAINRLLAELEQHDDLSAADRRASDSVRAHLAGFDRRVDRALERLDRTIARLREERRQAEAAQAAPPAAGPEAPPSEEPQPQPEPQPDVSPPNPDEPHNPTCTEGDCGCTSFAPGGDCGPPAQ